MGTLNGGKKKRYHKCMNSKSVKSYLNQHIELFGDQIYKESQRTKKATFNYLDSKIDTIDSFKRAIKNCEECNLSACRNKFVFGSGDPNADLLLIGEGPGREEDLKGEPFIGRSGKLLDKILKAIGYSRSEKVFITNIVKCRPPENRNPLNSEIEKCKPYLIKQINLIKPKLLVALGKVAGHSFLETDLLIKEMRNNIYSYNSIPLVITYHPSALLRNPVLKKDVWEDFQNIRDLLKT